MASSSNGGYGGTAAHSPPRTQHVAVEMRSPLRVRVYEEASGLAPPPPVDAAESAVMRRSLEANVVLSAAKAVVAVQSGSLAVLASLLDSALDLVSQLVLVATAAAAKNRAGGDYPAGRARLEPVGVVVCAMLMGLSAAFVLLAAAQQLAALARGDAADVDVSLANGATMAVAVLWKAALYAWIAARHDALVRSRPAVAAVNQDHFNDVLSNVVALGAAVLAARYGLAYADPVGAVGISVYIAYSWLETGIEQVQHLVGRSADPAFLEELRACAGAYSDAMQCDIVRAYHFGPRYLVELEMVMDAGTPLKVSHDLALDLQQRVEAIADVERAFVHVDYDFRDVDEHDVQSWSPGHPGAKPALL